MRVSVFGLGYVGAISAVCLVRDGHTVIGCDVDTAKLNLLRRGDSPVVEPGMEELVAHANDSGRLRVTSDAAQAIAESDLSLICVGTPAAPDGTPDLSAICRLATDVGVALARKPTGHLVVIRSTLLPGTTETVIKPLLEESSGKRAGAGFDVAFLPEFLREGSSLSDYDHPPFTIAGVESDGAAAQLRELYGRLPAEFCVTSIRVAELLKYSCNAFHALKIAFANEIGGLARSLAVDPNAVADLFCRDRQLNISTAYLRPGFAFGGPCLPKDVEALVHLAAQRGVQAPLLSAILPSNHAQIEAAVRLIVGCAPKTVGILGLSFKKGTDDLRTSPLVVLAQHLVEQGLEVKIFDPQVDPARLLGANRRAALGALPRLESMLVASPAELAAQCDVLVIGHDDEALFNVLCDHAREDQTIVDLVGLDPAIVRARYLRP